MSGWLLGGSGTDNLSVATSLWKVRDIVRRYLTSPDAATREQLVAELASLEGGVPGYVARILATDAASLDRHPGCEPVSARSSARRCGSIGRQRSRDRNGWHGRTEYRTAGPISTGNARMLDGETVTYHVQLPPEYDASRRYPTILTLHAAGSTPEMQIEWWAGSWDEKSGLRSGQATRHGYIVIAPEWASYRQREYGYSAREHAAVLYALRDALHRFSIDSDRVYLSGHSMGGDAAWEIALAHPDLWAGVIPISAVAEYGDRDSPNYVSRYWENAKLVPFYFVGVRWTVACSISTSRDWNRLLTHTGYDTMIVEYRGRGHEHFQDEIQRIFTWMGYHKRDFFPREFEVSTMRPLDNFFWWLEVDGIPSGSLVLPAQWPVRAVRPSLIEADAGRKAEYSC